MVAEYLSSDSDERIAVTVYGLNLLAISASTSILWHYALAENLVRQGDREGDVRALTSKLDPACRPTPSRSASGCCGPTPRSCSTWPSPCS
jgi:hypothetical protein